MTRQQIRAAVLARFVRELNRGGVHEALDAAIEKHLPITIGTKMRDGHFIPRMEFQPEYVAEIEREVRRALRI